jgi:DNA-directed RNA polymerase beta' subunit
MKNLNMVSQINTVKFGILSDQDILNMSVCSIDKPSLVESRSVYDLRLGSTQSSVLCETCGSNIWQCPGHFGHIDLNTPIILFYKPVVSMLKCFCFHCSRILCHPEALILNNIYGYDNILAYLSKISTCSHCQSPHPDIKFDIKDNLIFAQHKYKNNKATKDLTPEIIKGIFDNVPDDDVKLLGIDTTMFHPRNLVLTKFPVIPTTCRPRMVTPDNISDDDLSIILADIVKNNNILTTCQKGSEKHTKALNAINFRILTYCDNTRGKAVHNTNHKAMTGIKERIARKGGLIRKNLMGKRCDQTGRTVIGPDPTLSMDQVGIPIEMADSLSIPEYVTPLNIERLTKIVNENKAVTVCKPNGDKKDIAYALNKQNIYLQHGDEIMRANGHILRVTNCKMPIMEGDKVRRKGKWLEIKIKRQPIVLQVGDKVERFLQDGDIVILNRQPTLHKNSMQGMKIVRKPGKTLRMNLSQTSGFNADFLC